MNMQINIQAFILEITRWVAHMKQGGNKTDSWPRIQLDRMYIGHVDSEWEARLTPRVNNVEQLLFKRDYIRFLHSTHLVEKGFFKKNICMTNARAFKFPPLFLWKRMDEIQESIYLI